MVLKDTSPKIRRNKRKVWEEQDIPSQGYDIPHIDENWVDEGSLGRYLRLSKWCLCDCENSSSGDILDQDSLPRLALPEDGRFLNTHILFGILDPYSTNKSSKSSAMPIPVVVREPKCWVVDRSRHLRGLWIQSSKTDFWYWLKDPCTDMVMGPDLDSTTSGPSQDVLHAPLRAKMGLLSNLIDLIQENDDGKPFNYLPIMSKRSPQVFHQMLTPTPNQWEYFRHLSLKSDEDKISDEYPFLSDIMNKNFLGNSYPLLNKEPFDLDLLKTCADFIRQHLANIHPYLNRLSNFMKGLTVMQADYEKYLKSFSSPSSSSKKSIHPDSDGTQKFKQFSHEDYLSSAIQAEERGFRQPWGELIHDSATQPNRWIEFMVQYNLSNVYDDIPIMNVEMTSTQEETLCEFIQCVMRGLKDKKEDNNPKIFSQLTIQLIRHSTIRMEKPYYSSIHICLALRGLSSVLLPTPTSSELMNENVTCDYIDKYHFTEEKVTDLMDLILGDYPDSRGLGHVPSVEWMYIIVNCLCRSGPKVLKALFKSKSKGSLAPFVIIFKHWLPLAMHRVKRASALGCESLFIQRVMQLIVDCSVINSMNQITILIKLSVDWFYIVDKILDFAIAHKMTKIIQSAKLARKHLDGIKASTLPSKDSVDPLPVLSTVQAPLTSPEPMTKEKDMRQKRLSQLLKIAKDNAGSLVQKPVENQIDLKTSIQDSYKFLEDTSQVIDLSNEPSGDQKNSLQRIIPKSRTVPINVETNSKQNITNGMNLSKGSLSSNQHCADDNIHDSFYSPANEDVQTSEMTQRNISISGQVVWEKASRNISSSSTTVSFSATTAKDKFEEGGSANAMRTAEIIERNSGTWNLSIGQEPSQVKKAQSTTLSVERNSYKSVTGNSSAHLNYAITNTRLVSSSPNVANDCIGLKSTKDKCNEGASSETSWDSAKVKLLGNASIGADTSATNSQGDTIIADSKSTVSVWARSNATNSTASWANATKMPGSTAPSWGSWKPIQQNETHHVRKTQSTTYPIEGNSNGGLVGVNAGDSTSAILNAPFVRSFNPRELTVPRAQDQGVARNLAKVSGVPAYDPRTESADSELVFQNDNDGEIVEVERGDRKINITPSKMVKTAEAMLTSNTQSGRGRGSTLPAWMVKSNLNQEDSSISVPDSMKRHCSPRSLSDSSSPTMAQSGRGRGRTLPAWMVKSAPTHEHLKISAPGSDLDRCTDGPPAYHDETESQSADSRVLSLKEQHEDEEGEIVENVDSSPSRITQSGRGRGGTSPAWMVRSNMNQEDSSISVPDSMKRHCSPRSLSDSSSPTISQSGRGRGRTLPAWMVKSAPTHEHLKISAPGSDLDRCTDGPPAHHDETESRSTGTRFSPPKQYQCNGDAEMVDKKSTNYRMKRNISEVSDTSSNNIYDCKFERNGGDRLRNTPSKVARSSDSSSTFITQPGRGRGAWMVRSEMNEEYSSIPAQEQMARNSGPRVVSDSSSPTMAQPGRGRGRTLPAWMASQR